MIKVKCAPQNAKILHACAQYFSGGKKSSEIRQFMQRKRVNYMINGSYFSNKGIWIFFFKILCLARQRKQLSWSF